MKRKQKVAQIGRGCVACGNCVKHCPKNAIVILKGIRAVVDPEKCVGCGKCVKACPAGIISLQEKEAGL